MSYENDLQTAMVEEKVCSSDFYNKESISFFPFILQGEQV